MKPTFNYRFVNSSYKDEAKLKSEFNPFEDKKLGVHCIKNAFLIPYSNSMEGNVLDESFKSLSSNFKETIAFNNNTIKHRHKAIFIGDFWSYVWGHCFSDHFCKLWYVLTDKCKQQRKESVEFVFLSRQTQVPHYFYDLFLLAGFDLHEAKMITEITQYEELYIPDDCYYKKNNCFHRFYTKEYISIIEGMKEQVRTLATANTHYPLYDKIYLTRTQGTFEKAFRDIGEKSVENVFRDEGFTIIAPEKYTVAQQIWLTMNCKHLVATDGSICHIAFFCSLGTEVTILQKADFLTENIVSAAHILNLNITYVAVHHSIFCNKTEPWHGPFFLCVTNNLQSYIGHRIHVLPYYLTMHFYVYCLRELYVRTIHKSILLDGIIKKILNVKISKYTG